MDLDPECFSPTEQQEITQQGFELFNMPFSLWISSFNPEFQYTVKTHQLQGKKDISRQPLTEGVL